MLRFSDIRILWKVLCLMCLLSLVTLAGTIYSTSRMRFIDSAYGDLIDGYEKQISPWRGQIEIWSISTDPSIVC